MLDFFTLGSINNLPMLRRLQARYGDALRVIGVHSGKFAYEKRPEAVAEAAAHTITSYSLGGTTVNWRVGNRFEALRDGEGEAAQLAQSMGIARCDSDDYRPDADR